MGIRGAELGVEGVESGVEGTESGVEGAGSGDRGVGYEVWSLERLGREMDFFIENSEKMADNNTVLGLQIILRSTKGNMHVCVDLFVTRPT